MPIITPRLILRPPQVGEGTSLNEALLESLDDLRPWMPWAKTAPSLADSEANVRSAYAKWITREDLRISIYDKATGMLAGSTGLHRINWQLPSFEIGYWVRTRFAGQGYISESTNALTRYAFNQLGAKRVEIRCDSKNLKSLSIMKRLGFEHEGTLRRDSLACNTTELRDTLVYSRLSPDGLPQLSVNWSS